MSEECTNITCEKDADYQVTLIGVSSTPRPYCEKHYEELKSIERAER